MTNIVRVSLRVAAVSAIAFAAGYTLGFLAPSSAFAASGHVNCAHPAQGEELECVERVLATQPQEEETIGFVAYVAPRCDLFIAYEFDTQSFALVDYTKRNVVAMPQWGFLAHKWYLRSPRDFSEGRKWLYFGYQAVQIVVEKSNMTAEEAANAYLEACER